ncbi:MAG: hypothetical protein AAF409_06080 [Pseudomonadota bacterium]
MQDDDYKDQGRGSGKDTSQDNRLEFGDFAVIGTNIQIVLGGRLIAHPGN